MICEMVVKKNEDVRKNVSRFHYKVRCPYCGEVLHREKIDNFCNNCLGSVPNKLKMLFGFKFGRVRYYNNNFVNFDYL